MEQSLQQERAIVMRLIAGDENAFLILFKKYSPILSSFLSGLQLPTEDVHDVIQQSFLKIWEQKERINPDTSFKNYLITIAKNDIYNKIKHQVIRRKHQDHITYLQEKETTTDSNELTEVLYKILNNLPEKRREVYELSRIKGYSNQEISEKLGISKSTVENHINNSSAYIKKILKSLGFIFVYTLFH
ncbi:RNA polymerase sigma-70 factor [Sphingobacterium alkalisoli]|uniref:RNA polymerase sigma-70 factor n=1 Tax=Sphingobacterium alkalisoli TaxID=1874115 RepID=A0A4U0H272_9SPHI|nr:RNA polymerase sigma-70 factor [Sphingobacterium alkalisoli]TJY64372.1 RNA polymerase sigma-70 factor [Sphingobacterium alkalisoli]GGH22145.1 DNA-directed RNA polymerase sigma-70 factor [Sphingobacterium alkalisoli]